MKRLRKTKNMILHWIARGDHLPECMRDFHDQKELFQAIDQECPNPADMPDSYKVDWMAGSCYVIDRFLRFMAGHGWALRRVLTPPYRLESGIRAGLWRRRCRKIADLPHPPPEWPVPERRVRAAASEQDREAVSWAATMQASLDKWEAAYAAVARALLKAVQDVYENVDEGPDAPAIRCRLQHELYVVGGELHDLLERQRQRAVVVGHLTSAEPNIMSIGRDKSPA